MSDIMQLRNMEMDEIQNFHQFIEEYGHIFYGNNSELEEAFDKIMKGIDEVKEIVDNYYSY